MTVITTMFAPPLPEDLTAVLKRMRMHFSALPRRTC